MNDKIMLIAISGDGNKKDGLASVYLYNHIDNKDTYQEIEINNQDDINLMNDLIGTDVKLKNTKESLLHIDLFKEYIKRTRPKVFSDYLLSKFNANNEKNLFSLFSTMGNVLIQVSEYATLIYVPEHIDSDVKETLIKLKDYAKEETIIAVLQSKTVKDSTDFNFTSYNEFIENFITKEKSK